MKLRFNLSVRPRATPKRRRAELRFGIVLLILIIAACVFVPIIDHTSPDALISLPYAAPSWSHPFGTDDYGRDLLVRVFIAGRLDLVIATVTLLLSITIGTLIGMIAGATRLAWLDAVLMRIVDAVVAFPFIILTLALIVVIGNGWSIGPLPSGAGAIIISIVLIDWTVYARLARSETLTLRNRDYITAARMLGYSPARIITRHLLPGVGRVTATYAVADVVLIIVWTASLSFLGVGIRQPTAELGSIMFEGRAVLSHAWWITTIPGILIVLIGIALSAIADSLLHVEVK